jgi:type I restriction enzyme, S subunit
MSEWMSTPIGELLQTHFPGEWGAAPNLAGNLVRVFRGADFVASGRLERDGGAPRRVSCTKLMKIELQPGDLLLEKSGGSPDQPVGRVSYFEGAEGRAVASNFLQTLRPSNAVNSKFLFYLLQHEYARGRVLPFQQQTTGIINFRLKDYLKEQVAVPESPEDQRRIADLLSALDEQIAQAELLLEMRSVVRDGVVRDALARLEDAPLEPLGNLAEVGGGITLGRRFTGPGTFDYPYLRVANVQDGHIDLADVKTLRLPESVAAKARLEPGDVLMNEGGDFDKLGRGAVWRGEVSNCLHQNHVFRVRCNQELLLPDFLALWAASEFGKKYFRVASKQSTNLASINSTQLKKFPVLRPSLGEQRHVLRVIDSINAVLDLDRQQSAKLRLLKHGLARRLLSGETEVEL